VSHQNNSWQNYFYAIQRGNHQWITPVSIHKAIA
jgi:hypothetical protein